MAETKSRNSRSSSQTGSRRKTSSSRSKNGASSAKSGGSSRKASASKGSATSSRKPSSTSRSRSSGSSSTTRARSSGGRSSSGRASAAKAPDSTLGKVASKAKAPALAGGAALVGLAGGIALNRNGKKRSGILSHLPSPGSTVSKLKLPKPKRPEVDPDAALKGLGKAAETVAARSRQVGDVAGQVQRASDAIRKAKG